MGRVRGARTRKCKPKPENSLTKSAKICLIHQQNHVQFFLHRPYFPVYNCTKLNYSIQSKYQATK